MDRKPKASNPPGKATRPKEDQKAQSERFIETARAIGVDESGRKFERAITKVIPPKKRV